MQAPSPLWPARLDHLRLDAADVGATVAFYRDVLGMNALPDTGQTASATSTFGEDADYVINAPSFTDNGNGTVTESATSGTKFYRTVVR